MSTVTPFHLEGTAGALFCLHFPAPVRSQRAVLVLPAFAEEMNKCRRMVALAARALQRSGLDVLLVDLFGTGDSAGDFADASHRIWRDDLLRASRWLASRGVVRLDLLAVRGGALLLQEFKPPVGMQRGRIVLWSPVVSGKLLVTQFLRLRVAEGMAAASGAGVAADARTGLRAGGTIEVGGYELSGELVSGIEKIIDPLCDAAGWQGLHWFDVVAEGVGEPAPVARRELDRLRERGANVTFKAIAGDPFWGTPEIAVVPRLIEATVGALAAKDT